MRSLGLVAAAALQIRIDDSCTAADNCRETIAAAIARCRGHGAPCAVWLTGSHYRLRCPAAHRASTTMWRHPAIDVSHTADLTIGGEHGAPPPTVTADYVGEGCAVIAGDGATGLAVRNVVLDAFRLPFTVGEVVSAERGAVRFRLERDGGERPGAYAWDPATYPWLLVADASQAVPRGQRATRELHELGIANYTSERPDGTGVVTLRFAAPAAAPRYAALKPGTRIFLKHFSNLPSWGVYLIRSQGLSIEGVSLLSVSGMGYRCDFCASNAGAPSVTIRRSSIGLAPGTQRPMSITADAVHFMHTSGKIVLEDSSFEAQGDDGFNVHGNFVVVGRRVNSSAAQYVDETGPGWVTALPSLLVGDTVAFYSRGTLAPLGHAVIASADADTVVFDRPIPKAVLLWDMFISLDRVASLEMTGCTFANSNARGVVLSAVNATLRNNTFANLTCSAVTVTEGGCGAEAGDYTEGPLSSNVVLSDNVFHATTSVYRRMKGPGTPPWGGINNAAAVQVSGCHPIGTCGVSGGLPAPTAPVAALPANAARAIQIVPFQVPQPAVVTHLKYQAEGAGLSRVQMAVYSSSYRNSNGTIVPCDHPTSRVALALSGWGEAADGWHSAELQSPVELAAGPYFVALWYAGGPWRARVTPGTHRWWQRTEPGLPPNMAQNWSAWTDVQSHAVPVAAEWKARGGWCDAGGTLPPPIVAHVGDGGRGRITERGDYVQGRQWFSRLAIEHNRFTSPVAGMSGFVNVGGVVRSASRLGREGGVVCSSAGAAGWTVRFQQQFCPPRASPCWRRRRLGHLLLHRRARRGQRMHGGAEGWVYAGAQLHLL